jgi:hypothetical protein
LRRDFRSLLELIRAHALLHQATRPRDDYGRIVATAADYYAVRTLVGDVISQGLGATVPDEVREAVDAVRELLATNPEGVDAKAVGDRLGIDRTAAWGRVWRARRGGYLSNQETRRGRPGRYVLGEPLPETVDLLPDLPADATATVRRTEHDRESPGQERESRPVAWLHGFPGEGIQQQDEEQVPPEPEDVLRAAEALEWPAAQAGRVVVGAGELAWRAYLARPRDVDALSVIYSRLEAIDQGRRVQS